MNKSTAGGDEDAAHGGRSASANLPIGWMRTQL